MSDLRLPAGWTLIAFDQIGSTNQVAIERAEAGAAEGTVVWAREQLAGRGRRGRSWQSPRGNVFSSVIVRPHCPPGQAAQLSFVVSLAVADAAAALLAENKAITLKWPNDVLIGGAKMSGILLESSAVADGKVAYVVIGVGINLAAHPPAGETPYPTTSLQAEGCSAEVEETLHTYLAALAARLGQWRGQGFAAIRTDWMARAANLGCAIEVRLAHETLRGVFSRLDEGGALVLSLPDGGERAIAAGEIFPVAA